jgi:hypothetical protein
MDEKALTTSLTTLASAIASLSRSVIAMQRGDSLTANEQIEVCVGLLANFQDAQEKIAASRPTRDPEA